MRNQLADIQVLRALAAVMVVAYHLQPLLNDSFGARLNISYGGYGVDIFFVISGFIMFHTNRRLDKRPGRFMLDRAIRIMPLYWLATLFLARLFAVGHRLAAPRPVEVGST